MDIRHVLPVLFAVLLVLASPATAVDVPSGNTNSATTTTFTTSSPSNDPPNVSVTPNENGSTEVLVHFEDVDTPESVNELRTQATQKQQPFVAYANRTEGVTVKNRFWISNTVLVSVDATNTSLDTLARIQGVKRIRNNVKVTTATTTTGPPSQIGSTPTSTAFNQSTTSTPNTTYGVSQIQAPTVWETYHTRGEGVRIAILDSGVDLSHRDISLYSADPEDSTYPGGWAEFTEDGDRVRGSRPHDPIGHGTHVSGTVIGGNASGTQIGVAPAASLMHAQVLSDDGSGTLAQVLAGMEWAVKNDADVIGVSLGVETYESEFIEPIQSARSLGTTVVAAIGNNGAGSSDSPGNIYTTTSVGAVNANGEVPAFSGGESIDVRESWGGDAPRTWPSSYVVPRVTAPGVDVLSATGTGTWAYRSGTSMAVPHVVGGVALVQSATPTHHSPANITTALTETAWKPESWSGSMHARDRRYGAGIIDTSAAAAYLQDESPNSLVSIRSATLNTSHIGTNDSVTVTAVIENTGRTTDTFTGELRINGDVTDQQAVSVPAGDTTHLVFEPTFTQRGEYTIAVNDTTAGNLTVAPPPNLTLTDAQLETTTVSTGQPVNVSFAVSNDGGVTGIYDADLTWQDITLASTRLPVAPGETNETTISTTFATTGSYPLSLNDRTVGRVNVTDSPRAHIVNASVSTDTVQAGDEFTVTATLRNPGDSSTTATPALAINGRPHSEQTVSLAGGEQRQITYSVTLTENGTYTLTVEDTTAGTVTIQADWLASYLGDDGTVTDSGLNTAVRDYLNDELSANRLNTVIRSYLLN